jgi:hypothetical protein
MCDDGEEMWTLTPVDYAVEWAIWGSLRSWGCGDIYASSYDSKLEAISRSAKHDNLKFYELPTALLVT